MNDWRRSRALGVMAFYVDIANPAARNFSLLQRIFPILSIVVISMDEVEEESRCDHNSMNYKSIRIFSSHIK